VYLLNQCRVLPEYLRLVVWPSPLRIDWGLPQPLALGDAWAGALLLVALLGLSLYALRRWPAAGFVGVACFGLLAPSSSVVPIASEVGADRRMYLPLALLVPFALALAARALGRTRFARLGPWLAALVVLDLGLQSAARAARYADPVALWQAEAAAVPGNARARYNLAGVLAEAGRSDEAAAAKAEALRGELDFYTRILPYQPDRALALADVAGLHLAAGDYARAAALYEEALGLAPDDTVSRRRLELLRARREAQRNAAPE
jgi:tetratricopeptide (TPR) repeat protein